MNPSTPSHRIQGKLSSDLLSQMQQVKNSSSVFKIGDVLYVHKRGKPFCGITRLEFERDWVNRSSMGDVYLPKFCALIYKVRQELLRQPFGEFREMGFPRLLPLDVAKSCGLIEAWPDILLSVQAFAKPKDARALDQHHGKFLLDPLQCAPAYAWLTGRELHQNELPICIREELGGWSYRNERKEALSPVLKAVEFLRNEYIFIGTPEKVRDIRAELVDAFCGYLEESDLQYRVTVGMGCFELEKDELSQKLKATENLIDIPILDVEVFLPEEGTWLEVLGSSLWQSKLVESFKIRSKRIKLESGCVGIGVSRLSYGMLAQLGSAT